MRMFRILPALVLALSLAVPATSAQQSSSRPRLIFRDRANDSVPYLYQRSYGATATSTRIRLPSGGGNRCARTRSLLGLFSPESFDCSGGWTFPGLIDGDCPIAVCVAKTRDRGTSVFGSTNR